MTRLVLSIVPVVAILAAGGWLSPALAGPGQETIDQKARIAEEQAHEAWRTDMVHVGTPGQGCFQAEYPSNTWTKTECQTVTPRAAPRPPRAAANPGETTGQTAGDGHDYAIQSSGLITSTVGSFPQVINVTSEQSVGVPLFGNGGLLGPNEYTLQINSNLTGTTAACSGGNPGCKVWQQFIYAPDQLQVGFGGVFIEYWLIDYGNSCPIGFNNAGQGDCWFNSAGVNAPDEPITELANMKLSGSATAGGNDTVTFTHGTQAYAISAADSVLYLAQVWQQSEFNVVGDGGGSEAVFNTDASVTVKIAITDGTSNRPTCLANAGSTGETNNFNLSACAASAGLTPSVEFTEFNGTPVPVPALGSWGLLGAALMLGGVGYSVMRRRVA
jgi:hypothetical protein